MNDLDALAAEIRRRLEAKRAAEKPKPDDKRENPRTGKKPRPTSDRRRKV